MWPNLSLDNTEYDKLYVNGVKFEQTKSTLWNNLKRIWTVYTTCIFLFYYLQCIDDLDGIKACQGDMAWMPVSLAS